MAQPYVGEIRLFAGNFAPAGWASCEGQLLSISENETLFNLIGTTYGGDGQQTFALPDLRGRVPVHQGNSYTLAQSGGTETVALSAGQIPSHNHSLVVADAVGDKTDPAGNFWAQSAALVYASTNDGSTMAQGSLASEGGGQPHENMMPFVCLTFIISLFGIFPSQT